MRGFYFYSLGCLARVYYILILHKYDFHSKIVVFLLHIDCVFWLSLMHHVTITCKHATSNTCRDFCVFFRRVFLHNSTGVPFSSGKIFFCFWLNSCVRLGISSYNQNKQKKKK